MEKIEDLENKYGKPDILIDSSNCNSSRYAVWGIDEVFKIVLTEVPKPWVEEKDKNTKPLKKSKNNKNKLETH